MTKDQHIEKYVQRIKRALKRRIKPCKTTREFYEQAYNVTEDLTRRLWWGTFRKKLKPIGGGS